MRRSLLPLLLVLAGCGGPELLDRLARNPDRGTRVVRDLAYGEEPRQKLDLYVPAREGPHPILIFFHGGGWDSGSKDAYGFAGRRFAAEGYLTAVPSYRLRPGATYPVFMHDAAAAVAETLRRAPDEGGDPDRLFLVGHSAGAYNAVQLAVAPEFLAEHGLTPAVIDAVAGLAGPYDFLPLDPGAAEETFGTADDLAATQPVRRVTDEAPPMILVTGDADAIVRPENSAAMVEALREAGVDAQLVTYPGKDHVTPVVALAFPRRAPVVRDVTTFFDAHGAGLGGER